MCPITTVQKWVRCRFADWVVASDKNWHHGYDGLLNEYQRALRNGATDLKRAPRKQLRQHLYKPTARLMELESVLSHDEWEPVDNRDELWAELAELLVRNPHLRTILTVPDEAMAEADIKFRDWWLVDSYEDEEDVWAQQSGVINKWEYAERIVTRRSWGKIPHWDAHCEVPNFAYLLRQNAAAWPLFDDGDFVNGNVPAIKMLRCMRDGFPADMNAAAAAYFVGCFDDYPTVHCSLADLFAVDWDVSCASAEHSGGAEEYPACSVVGAHPSRRELVGDDFCAGLAALERQITGAGLSSEDFRFLICFPCELWL